MSTQNSGGTLKPWRPGQSGNPGGRPKTRPFKDALEAALEEAGEDGPALLTIARALRDKAKAGDLQSIKEIGDRLDGRPVQQLEYHEPLGVAAPVTRRVIWEIIDGREELEDKTGEVIEGEAVVTNGKGNGHGE
jgi:hypothetical protein